MPTPRKLSPKRLASNAWRWIWRIASAPVRALGRLLDWNPSIFKLASILTIVAAALFLGIYFYPKDSPIPPPRPRGPLVAVVADQPNLQIELDRINLANNYITIEARIAPVSTDANIYVIVDDATPESEGNPEWQFHRWPSGDEAALHLWLPAAPAGYEIRPSLTLSDCACYAYSQPYLSLSTATIDGFSNPTNPLLVGDSPGLNATREKISSSIFPSLPPGVFYPIRAIGDPKENDIDLGGIGLPQDLSVVNFQPSQPAELSTLHWSWSKISQGSMTLTSLEARSHSDSEVFTSGIFLGIAGAGVIVLADISISAIAAARSTKTATAGGIPTVPLEGPAVVGQSAMATDDAQDERPRKSPPRFRHAIFASATLGLLYAIAKALRRR